MSTRALKRPELPSALADLEEPPETLFLTGQWPAGPVVAVVGTRRPSQQAAAFAERLVSELASAGVVVASGGARGIDTVVHSTALESGGQTLVVAPSSFDKPYPEDNAELFRRIVEHDGAYISEFGADVVARRHHFFRRNSVLVALAQVVVIVEAPLQSGARNAAHWARRLSRPLFAVPFAPWHARGRGNLEELRLGAQCLVSPADVLKTLTALNLHAVGRESDAPWVDGRPSTQATLPFSSSDDALSPEEQTILDALSTAPMHLDQLVEATRLPVNTLQVRITELCVMGRLRPLPGGRFARG